VEQVLKLLSKRIEWRQKKGYGSGDLHRFQHIRHCLLTPLSGIKKTGSNRKKKRRAPGASDKAMFFVIGGNRNERGEDGK